MIHKQKCGHCDCKEIDPTPEPIQESELSELAESVPNIDDIVQPNFGYYFFCFVIAMGILIGGIYVFVNVFSLFLN